MDLLDILKKARSGPLSPILGLAYEGLCRLHLLAERLYDLVWVRPVVAPELDDLTAVIKTFERPDRLRRLVHSIRRRYPRLRIIVVDDSKRPLDMPGVDTVLLPYDSGVSAGRNAGLAQVDTAYTLVLDDDFVFYRRTDIRGALGKITQAEEIDLIAGEVVNLPLRHTTDYVGAKLFPTGKQPLIPEGTRIAGLPVMNKVPNFYIGRTARLRDVGWDDRLKRIDHADFFTRAVGVLVSVQDRHCKVLHHPSYFDRRYLAIKQSAAADRVRLREKYGGSSG